MNGRTAPTARSRPPFRANESAGCTLTSMDTGRAGSIVTSAEAMTPSSVAVTIAVPGWIAARRPFEFRSSTVTTLGFDDAQVAVLVASLLSPLLDVAVA